MQYDIGRCRIVEMLSERGWTQQDLADRSGYSKQTVSFYATMRRKRMPLDIAVSFADVLGCSPRDLYEWIPKN